MAAAAGSAAEDPRIAALSAEERRTCGIYATCKVAGLRDDDPQAEAKQPQFLAACLAKWVTLSPAEQQEIAKCADAEGACMGPPACFDAMRLDAPSWRLARQPDAPPCGSKPLALPPAGAKHVQPDRPLPHADAITTCQDQASVAALCDCLARSVATWGAGLGLSPQVECKPHDAQLVEVTSKPADDSTAGGEAYVFVAHQGARWSPVATIESAPDVDLSTTPQASETASIDQVIDEPLATGTLYWIESRHDAQDKDTGDTDHDGEAHGTICIVPTSGAPSCTKPVTLAAWSYAFTPTKDACTITKVATYAAELDPSSLTIRLEHGNDESGTAGRYTF